MNPPTPPQPAYQPPAPGPAPLPHANPGKVTGIIGIVLSFLFLAPIGLILSIVSTVQSHKARQSTVLGVVGIVLNALGMITGLILFAITIVAYSGVQDRAATSASQSAANVIVKRAEAHYTILSTYPESLSDFGVGAPESKLENPGHGTRYIDGTPSSQDEIGYKRCSADGAQVYYLDRASSNLKVIGLGDASYTTPC